jgi:hypothetical protein
MNNPVDNKPHGFSRGERALRHDGFLQELITVEPPSAGAGLLPTSTEHATGIDYSEEAIPERDPNYRLTDGTLHDTETVEHLPASVRQGLARCLEELGMSPSRAAWVANL